MTRIFHWFFMWKMDPMSGFDIRLVFTLPPKDSTLQYKISVYTSEITFLALVPCCWCCRRIIKESCRFQCVWCLTSICQIVKETTIQKSVFSKINKNSSFRKGYELIFSIAHATLWHKGLLKYVYSPFNESCK